MEGQVPDGGDPGTEGGMETAGALNRAPVESRLNTPRTAAASSNGGEMEMPTGAAQAQLRSVVERIERLEAEKAAISADIKEVYAEAKGNGFDPKILRKVIRLRKVDPSERDEEQALLDVYMHALGMVPTEPAGS